MKHNHGEAFKIMNYRCSDCGLDEQLWNSRDGVTPFGISCPRCKGHNMTHINWSRDAYFQNLTPPAGMRVFVSMTKERAEFWAWRRLEVYESRGQLPADGIDFKSLVADIYRNGQAPDVRVASGNGGYLE